MKLDRIEWVDLYRTLVIWRYIVECLEEHGQAINDVSLSAGRASANRTRERIVWIRDYGFWAAPRDAVRGWLNMANQGNPRTWCPFGVAESEPRPGKPLSIAIEINLPLDEMSRPAGRLFEDVDGGYWLGHSGHIRLGRTGCDLTEHLGQEWVNRQPRNVVALAGDEATIVIGKVDCSELLPRLGRFLHDVQAVRDNWRG